MPLLILFSLLSLLVIWGWLILLKHKIAFPRFKKQQQQQLNIHRKGIKKQILSVRKTGDAYLLPWQLCKKTLFLGLAPHQEKSHTKPTILRQRHPQRLSFEFSKSEKWIFLSQPNSYSIFLKRNKVVLMNDLFLKISAP